VTTVELGVQSLDAEVLRLSGRGHTAADCARAAALLKEAGFTLILQMMTGLPGDTPEKSLETARRIIALRPDGVRVYPTVIVRGTPLEALWHAGRYREHTVEEAVILGARLLDLFEEAGIPVIRFGLNPTDALSGGDAVGGAYHPALREKCEAERYYQKALALVSEADRGKIVTFAAGEGRTSQVLGQRRWNAARLRERFGIRDIRVVEKKLPPGALLRESSCNSDTKPV
ncbi:MAG: radical SAM protein, partial [bacterium]